jgi:hypothetical protein
MFDSDTSFIPNLIPENYNIPLTSDISIVNQVINKASLLSTYNFNKWASTSRIWNIEPILIDYSLPFDNKSFYFYFDLISSSDETEVYKNKINLCEIRFYNDDQSGSLLTGKITLEIILNKISLPSGGETYSGELKFSGFLFGSLTAFIVINPLIVPIVPTKVSGPTWVNPSDQIIFNKTKYQNMGFYALLQPQILMLNVSFG